MVGKARSLATGSLSTKRAFFRACCTQGEPTAGADDAGGGEGGGKEDDIVEADVVLLLLLLLLLLLVPVYVVGVCFDKTRTERGRHNEDRTRRKRRDEHHERVSSLSRPYLFCTSGII
jgi:hypothetical protein